MSIGNLFCTLSAPRIDAFNSQLFTYFLCKLFCSFPPTCKSQSLKPRICCTGPRHFVSVPHHNFRSAGNEMITPPCPHTFRPEPLTFFIPDTTLPGAVFHDCRLFVLPLLWHTVHAQSLSNTPAMICSQVPTL